MLLLHGREEPLQTYKVSVISEAAKEMLTLAFPLWMVGAELLRREITDRGSVEWSTGSTGNLAERSGISLRLRVRLARGRKATAHNRRIPPAKGKLATALF